MLQNYEYFLALFEKQNISRVIEKLYISHQCLSRYLKNLENECGLTLFERKPKHSTKRIIFRIGIWDMQSIP